MFVRINIINDSSIICLTPDMFCVPVQHFFENAVRRKWSHTPNLTQTKCGQKYLWGIIILRNKSQNNADRIKNGLVVFTIGVGRFRILGGPRFRILGGPRGGQFPSRHMTS